MQKENRNVDVESKIVSGIVRTPLSFLMGGPIGVIANILFTASSVNKEKIEENKRKSKKEAMLNKTAPTTYSPTSKEVEMMFRDYNCKFKSLKIITLNKLVKYESKKRKSKSGNNIINCVFQFNENEEKEGVILCAYDFWSEYYKYPEYDLKKYRVRYGREYMMFSYNDKFYYLGEIL